MTELNNPLTHLYHELLSANVTNDASTSARVQEVSEQIEAIYYDFENAIPMIYDILHNPEVGNLEKRHAAVGLKRVFTIHQQSLITDDFFQSDNYQCKIKPFVQILIECNNQYIAVNISAALEPIMSSFGEEWEDILEAVNILLSTNENIKIQIALTILFNLAQYLKPTYILSQMENYINLIVAATQMNDIEISVSVIKFFVTILFQIQETGPLPSVVPQVFALIFPSFQNIIYSCQNQDLVTQAVLYMSYAMKFESPVAAPEDILNSLYQITLIEEIELSRKIKIMYIASKVIKYHWKSVNELIPPVLSTMITLCSAAFIDSGYEDEEDAKSIIDFVVKISSRCQNNDQLFNIVLSCQPQEANDGLIFAYIGALYGLIDNLLVQVEQNLSSILKYLIGIISQSQSLSVIEIGLKFINDSIIRFNCAVSHFANEILEIVFQFFKQATDDLDECVLDVMTSLFDNVDIEYSVIQPYLSTLIQLLKNNSINMMMYGKVIRTIGTIVKLCREEAETFTPEILPIVWDLAFDETPEANQNRAYSIEALSYLICYAPNCFQDSQYSYETAIQMFLIPYEAFRNNDIQDDNNDYLIQAACLSALIQITRFYGKDIDPGLSTLCFQPVFKAIGIKTNDEDDLNEVHYDMVSKKEIICDGFKLLKMLLKNSNPEVIKSVEPVVESLFQDFVKMKDNAIASYAIKAGVYFEMYRNNENSAKFFDILYENTLTSEEDQIVSVSLLGYFRLIKNQHVLASEYADRFQQVCFSAILRKLRCQTCNIQDESERFNYDYDLMINFYNVISEIMEKFTQQFDGESFIQSITQIFDLITDEEKAGLFGTLGIYVVIGGQVSIDFINSAVELFDQTDFVHDPNPIFFVRSVISHQPQILVECIDQLIQYFYGVIRSEVSSGTYYWQTVTNSISAVFEIFIQPIFQGSINLNEILNEILDKLPVKGDYEEAQFIYNILITLMEKHPTYVVPHINKLLAVFMQTITLKSTRLEEYKLSEETMNKMVSAVSQLLSRPEFQENRDQFITEVLGNSELKIQKLCQLIQLQ